jgi:hypothetical protein
MSAPPLTRLNGPDARGHGSVGADQSRTKPWRVGKHHISLACKVHARGSRETSAGRVPGFFGSGRARRRCSVLGLGRTLVWLVEAADFLPAFPFPATILKPLSTWLTAFLLAASSGGRDKPSNPSLGHIANTKFNSGTYRGVSSIVPAL